MSEKARLATIKVGGVRLSLFPMSSLWVLDPIPDSPEWDWRERGRQQLDARLIEMRANDVPSPGYDPDRVLARADAVVNTLGGNIIYVRPMLSLEEQGLHEDEHGDVRDNETGGLIVF